MLGEGNSETCTSKLVNKLEVDPRPEARSPNFNLLSLLYWELVSLKVCLFKLWTSLHSAYTIENGKYTDFLMAGRHYLSINISLQKSTQTDN